MILEVIGNNAIDAIEIEKSGASQIELIYDSKNGGLTPSKEVVLDVLKNVNIPVNVMVRPHFKSFVYDKNDEDEILKTIDFLKTTSSTSIVFGGLTEDFKIDVALLEKVLSKKEHLQITFHRAIDLCTNYLDSMKILSSYNVDNILTSAKCLDPVDGIEILQKAEEILGDKTSIIVGGGVTKDNIRILHDSIKTAKFHIGRAGRFNHNYDDKINQEFIQEILNK